jgi:hypothetical protein
MHYFQVDDVAAWYQAHFPCHRPGYVVPALCADCARREIDSRHEKMKQRRR